MSTKFSVLLFIKRTKAVTNGLLPIYLRVTVNGQRFEVTTKRYVEAAKWSSEAGKMKGNNEEARSLNSYLDSLRSKAYDYHQDLVRDDKPLTAENFPEQMAWCIRQAPNDY